ncbi:hypothetical protein DPMN_110083 [Dreissena polymorpha]|uniref:Uncharacterized protein n=1 Tax=Dreissena polymorpha TaxID=45954 RepID=A0A9D4KBZ1_DREPO|nr:hypothetical protein DPMN_110083 [Dreissena polymorpha]
MGKHGLGEMNDNRERFADLAPQVTSSSKEVFSFTDEYTRQLGCHQTCQRRTRLTTYASQGSFVALFRMYVSSEEQTWLRTIIPLSPD